MVKIMENPIKMEPLFLETPIYLYTYIIYETTVSL